MQVRALHYHYNMFVFCNSRILKAQCYDYQVDEEFFLGISS